MNSVLYRYKPAAYHGQVIGKLSSSQYYVEEDVNIDDLANELNENEEIAAVGVVNNSHENLGIISRRDLFNKLSKPFGRDLYKNKNVKQFIEKTESFNYKKNIFSTASIISRYLNVSGTRYFLLETDEGKFAGVFSSKDIMFYLSEVTRKDISTATKLQSCIVNREKIIRDERCVLVGASQMAYGIGGDFYSIEKYNDTSWIITICDGSLARIVSIRHRSVPTSVSSANRRQSIQSLYIPRRRGGCTSSKHP